MFLPGPTQPVVLVQTEEDLQEAREAERKTVLLRAADLIRRDGFSNNPFGMTVRCRKHCLLGAVAHAMDERGHNVYRGWFMYGMDEPADLIGEAADTVYEWSDKPGRKPYEATRRLEELAYAQRVRW